jgi:APA family basic amino acid/polyamine antiporter
VLSCLYVMSGLPLLAWKRFGVWMLLGMVVYFAYGFRNSRLARAGPS